jgi:hypothetical protein
MECRDVRELADSFLADDPLSESSHELLRHLEQCPSCREELAARRVVRDSLRRAFATAPELAPRPEFVASLRATLRQAAPDVPADVPARRRFGPGPWWALTAALLLVAIALGIAYRGHDWSAAGAMARAAVGDHRDCALQFRLDEKPIRLADAARRYGIAYRVLETMPPDDIVTAAGPAHVVERHACVYRGRRFAHIVFAFRRAKVSMLVGTDDASGPAAARADGETVSPPRQVDGLTVVSFRTARHLVFFTGDVPATDLAALADAVAPSVRRELAGA